MPGIGCVVAIYSESCIMDHVEWYGQNVMNNSEEDMKTGIPVMKEKDSSRK
jgi:hypothetical protein